MGQLLKLFIILLMVGLVGRLSAQTIVSGQVISSDDGEPVPGANVIVEGTSRGISTDVDGRYSIEASPEDVLVFSFVGFSSVREKVGNRTRIDIAFELDISTLLEVVVMGYSEKSRRELSASATTLDDAELENVTSANIENMLQGKVAGVSVTTASGSPGEAAEIRIRGVNSLTADRPPLVVVDGMIGGTYQPNDVASVTVLKDAAATALYGSLASGGVIVVTTKGGTLEPEIEFSSSIGRKEITTGNFDVMNGAELYEVQETMWGSDLVNFLRARPGDLEDRNFDWVNEAYHPGWIQNYYLAARGGNERLKYSISADYFNEEGTLLETGFERISFRANLDFQLRENLSLRTNLSVIDSKRDQEFWDWRYDPFLYLPWDNPFNDDGSIKYIDNTTPSEWYGRDRKNILHSAQYNFAQSKNLGLTGNFFLTWDATDWLSFEVRNKVSLSGSRYEEFTDPRSREGRSFNGAISTSTANDRDIITTGLVRFGKKLGRHDFGGFVGIEGNYYFFENLGATGRNIPIGLSVIGVASEPVSNLGTNVTGTRMSYLSEVSYSLDDKYFITGIFRADGSSQFSPNVRWGYFPGASVSWIASSEDFFPGNGLVSFLKVRASYGEVGNDNVGVNPFPYLSFYSLSGQYNGSPAATIPLLANNQITWETLVSRNVGLDLELMDRVNLTVDYYNNKTVDMLLDVQLPFSSGFEEQTRNVGEVRNQGLEFSISSNVLNIGQFSWNSAFNMSLNYNENLQFADTDELQFGTENQQIARVGEELRQWFLPKWLGVDPANGDPLWEKVNRDDQGNILSREATSNYNEAEFQAVGSVLPRGYGGWTNTLNYRNFSLGILLSYQFGNEVYHRARQFFDNDGTYTEYNLMRLQDGWSRWEEPGDVATHPLPVRGGNKLSNAPSSRYLEDGSYIRLRNVSINYSFPAHICKTIGMQSLNIGLSGDNLLTWTDFSGLDPEARISNAAFELPGVQDFKYPISRQYLLKLTAKF